MYDSRSLDKGLRGQATIHRHMHKKGCTLAGQPLWIDEEKALVRAHYPDVPKLVILLVRRTPGAIRWQARQLGLVKPRTKWSSDELRNMPPPYKGGDDVGQIAQSLDNKTKKQVYGKASKLKVSRPKRPPTPTGMPIVDLILQRAHQVGYTRADLNEWSRRRRYWTAPRRYDWIAIGSVLKALGGEIVPVWR